MSARDKLELVAIWAPVALVVFIIVISLPNMFKRD